MSFEKINTQIQKLRYIQNEDIQAYLNSKQAWVNDFQTKYSELFDLLTAQSQQILQDVGHQKFNIEASQFPHKVFLFKAKNNQLSLKDLKKSLDTPQKILYLEQELKPLLDLKK